MSPEPKREVFGVGNSNAVDPRCGVGGKEEDRRPDDPCCCRKLLENIFGEDVEAELFVGVRAGVENVVVHRGDRDGDKNRAASGGVSRTKTSDKGLWYAVDDGIRTERNVYATSDGPRVAG